MKKKKPYIVLLRGVMPTGKNRIPKMSFLQEILSTEFDSVRTYIQSGNIVLISDRSRSEIAKKVFELIKTHWARTFFNCSYSWRNSRNSW